MTPSRRTFLKQSATVVAGAALTPSAPITELRAESSRKRVAPSDQLNIAVIGAKGMGWSDVQSHLKIAGVSCVAIADVDASVLAKRSADLIALGGKSPHTYGDYRRMLENKDIDVVVVATPDH